MRFVFLSLRLASSTSSSAWCSIRRRWRRWQFNNLFNIL